MLQLSMQHILLQHLPELTVLLLVTCHFFKVSTILLIYIVSVIFTKNEYKRKYDKEFIVKSQETV